VPSYSAQEYIDAMSDLRARVVEGAVDPSGIASEVAPRAKARAVKALVDDLARLAG
jgi:hypothetical protein